jgi:hypothetical protein
MPTLVVAVKFLLFYWSCLKFTERYSPYYAREELYLPEIKRKRKKFFGRNKEYDNNTDRTREIVVTGCKVYAIGQSLISDDISNAA